MCKGDDRDTIIETAKTSAPRTGSCRTRRPLPHHAERVRRLDDAAHTVLIFSLPAPSRRVVRPPIQHARAMQFARIDWIIIAVSIVVSFLPALFFYKRAG